MNKPAIIVTGANGQLGRELKDQSLHYPQFDYIFLSKEDLPIHDTKAVEELFSRVNPFCCINCAAYTAVDKAETEQQQSMQINGEAVGVLAEVSKKHAAKFIHISTDYVFDGNASQPYKEDNPTNPVNYYGSTKLTGEQLSQQFNENSLIIRTSWVYSEYGNNFVKTMLRLMKERDSLNVVSDQVGSPTYARDLADAIMQIVKEAASDNASWKAGIYHYSNEGVISWYDFAVAIKELSNSACAVNPIPSSAYPTPAKRPSYSVFDKNKIKSTYNIQIPAWKDSLVACIKKIQAQ